MNTTLSVERSARVDVTVAICTWNRAELLRKTLDKMAQLEVPTDCHWELLIIENQCTDNTRFIEESYNSRLPVRIESEQNQGLSYARNRAIASAQGKYIIWTDDDVLVAPGWLKAYWEAFSRWPEATIFGGRVTPWFEVEPPAWLGDNVDLLGGVYALRDFGEEERVLPGHENPYGANMAFRAADLKAYPFDPKLGRVADNLTSGEESAVIRAMRNDGHKVVWVPASEVSHFLPKSRMTFSYIFAFRRAVGANESDIDRCAQRCLFGVPLWIIRRRIYWEAQYQFDRITRPNSRSRIQSMSRAANLRGEWEAYRKAWRERI